MSILIKGMKMPEKYEEIIIRIDSFGNVMTEYALPIVGVKAVPVPPHGDLIDRDALIKDGWLCLHKEVVRMGGYAIHELPLKNPSIPVIIEAEEAE